MKNGVKTALRGGVSPDVGKDTQFKPGNPGGGRPRTAKFADACRELGAEVLPSGKTKVQRLAEYCYKRAMAGSAKHLEIFLYYAEGKPRNQSEELIVNDFDRKTDSQLEEFREKIRRGEPLEVPPKFKPN